MARIAFHYSPGNSSLHRWDARCKILGLLIITLALLSFNVLSFTFLSAMLFGLFIRSKLPLKQFFREFRFWLIFLLILFLFQVLFSQGTHFSSVPWVPMSKEGFLLGGIMVWRLGLILCYANLFTAITRPRELQEAITWFIRPIPFLPERRIGLMVSLTLHFFSVILDEIEEIGLAHKSRLGERKKNPFRRAKFMAFPLLRRSFSRAEEVTLALVARGYHDDRPIPLTKLPFSHLIPLFILLGSLMIIGWYHF